jgi:hypothetical protein
MPAGLSEGQHAAAGIIDELWRFAPDFLFANPAYLLWLVREVAAASAAVAASCDCRNFLLVCAALHC